MLKKVIGFNGSPRKGMNTDLLVQKALEGARSLGAQTKLIEISDLKHVQPCISCLHCKKNKNTEGRCVLKDDLTPVLKELKDVDALVIGTPVYWGYFSGAIHSALERIWFSNWSYNPSRKSVFGKKINTAFIWTMNVKKEVSDQMYSPFYKHTTWVMENVFGKCENLMAYNTLQVSDYSKYDLSGFDEKEKIRQHKEIFPHDLERAYELGKRLVQ